MVFYFKEAKMFFFIVWFILLFRRAEHRNHVYTLLGTNIQKYRFNYNSLINQSMLSDLEMYECTKQSTSKTNWQSSFIFEFSRPVVQLYLLAIHQFLLSLIWIIRRQELKILIQPMKWFNNQKFTLFSVQRVTWLHGYMVTWVHGYMVTWLHGYMVTWLHVWFSTNLCLSKYYGYWGSDGRFMLQRQNRLLNLDFFVLK